MLLSNNTWHKDYFELEAIEEKQEEGSLSFSHILKSESQIAFVTVPPSPW